MQIVSNVKHTNLYDVMKSSWATSFVNAEQKSKVSETFCASIIRKWYSVARLAAPAHLIAFSRPEIFKSYIVGCWEQIY
jgi:hypothetical protein